MPNSAFRVDDLAANSITISTVSITVSNGNLVLPAGTTVGNTAIVAGGGVGATGATGISGNIGPTGATGPAGATGAGSFAYGNTAPTSPTIGSRWLDSESGKEFIWVVAGATGVWMQAVGGSGTQGNIGNVGATGATGIGSTGATGVAGATGLTGATGAAGSPGSAGAGYDVTTNSTGYLALSSGTTAQRPVSPPNGAVRFNTTTGYGELYSTAAGQWLQFGASPLVNVEYLVVAGGGAGGSDVYQDRSAGGGGAGGMLTGTLSGLNIATAYSITVGGGGAGVTGTAGNNGSNSLFSSITSTGGGGGAGHTAGGNVAAGNGGSGGGSTHDNVNGPRGTGIVGQGYDGGTSGNSQGGMGLASGISGSLVTYAGGGGAGNSPGVSGGGGGGAGGTGVTDTTNGGCGGGGAGGNSSGAFNGTSGTTNTGGGGGGGREAASGNGGSGIVIIKYLANYSASFSVGITASTITSGVYKISTITAGTGTVTFTVG